MLPLTEAAVNDLIVPVPAPDASASASTISAAQTIRALAQRHGVVYQPTPLDAFAGDDGASAEVGRVFDEAIHGETGCVLIGPGMEDARATIALMSTWGVWATL